MTTQTTSSTPLMLGQPQHRSTATTANTTPQPLMLLETSPTDDIPTITSTNTFLMNVFTENAQTLRSALIASSTSLGIVADTAPLSSSPFGLSRASTVTTHPTTTITTITQIDQLRFSPQNLLLAPTPITTTRLQSPATAAATLDSIVSHFNRTTTTTPPTDVWAPSALTLLTWQQTGLLVFFATLIIMTVLGNTLVILSVITTRRLRTVTNCFVMSLAVADWMVGVFVMPPSVLLYIHGSWTVGWILCDIWVSLDILLCTASILSLCAISLDRYLAVTRPLNYKKRRTKRLAMFMIFVVWILALAITCPPILGWYEHGRRECRYNQNKGYVVFSAMGSFFIPMAVMLYVYTRICCVLASRHTRMTRTEASERTINDDIDQISVDFESGQHQTPKRKYSMRAQHQVFSHHHQQSVERAESQHTLYELVEISKSTSTVRTSSTITNYRFSAVNHPQFNPFQHFCPFQVASSLSESCLCRRQQQPTPSNDTKAVHPQQQQQPHRTMPPRQQSAAAGLGSYGKRVPIRISSSKRETKAAKTLSMVVGGFIACWLPFFIYYLLIPFLPRESVSDIAMSVLTWLGWVNSAINPFIYAFYNSDFRIAFWRLTFRKLCKSQTNRAMMLKT